MKEQDPNGLDQHSPGAKLDCGKPRPHLVLSSFNKALQEVVNNGTFGANKYTDNGWKEVENGKQRYLDAAMRHYSKYCDVDEPNRDEESYTHHLGAMAWNILAALEFELEGK